MHLVLVEDGKYGIQLAAKLLQDVQQLAEHELLNVSAGAQQLEAVQQLQCGLSAAQLPVQGSHGLGISTLSAFAA